MKDVTPVDGGGIDSILTVKTGEAIECIKDEDKKGSVANYFCIIPVNSDGFINFNNVNKSTMEKALIEACDDHTSFPVEVQACKQKLQDLCLDHTATPPENFACIINNQE